MATVSPELFSKSIHVTGLTATGLRKNAVSSSLRPFVVVSVDAAGEQRTRSLRSDGDASWDDDLAFTVRSTSIISLKVFHDGLIKRELGSITIPASDFWSHASLRQYAITCPLQPNSGSKSRSAYISLTLQVLANPNLDLESIKLEIDPVPNTLVQLQSPAASSASSAIDEATAVAPTIQAIYSDAITLSNFYHPMGDAIGYLDRLVQAIDSISEVHFIVKLAWQTLSSVYQLLKKQLERDQRVKQLAIMMADLFSWATETEMIPEKVAHLSSTLTLMAEQVKECALFIREYIEHGFLGRTLSSTLSSSFDSTLEAFKDNFTLLQVQFQNGVTVSTFRLLTRMDLKIQKEFEKLGTKQQQSNTDTKLLKFIGKQLPRVPDTSYNPSYTCFPGTRVTSLNAILSWSSSTETSNGEAVLWLTAEAGVGKSTIAHTIASQMDMEGRLAACFFLDCDFVDKRNPRLIVNTLAFRLACYSHHIAAGIFAALEKDLDLGYSTAVSHQFHKLIVEPITAVRTHIKPFVIILDELDALESSDQRKLFAREAFLTCIAQGTQHLAPIARFIITSRPERDIVETLASCSSIYSMTLNLQSLESQLDIEAVARHYLSKIHCRYSRLGKTWPGDENIQALVKHAAGLFIWITTACTFIYQKDPEKRLLLVLASDSCKSPTIALDELYRKALLEHVDAQGGSNSDFYDSLRQIMGFIATLYHPLSPKALNSLLNTGIYTEDIIYSLQSFLQVTKIVQPIHPSFVEFLLDKARCKDDRLFVDPEIYKQQVTKQCLICMHGLTKDICSIGDSTKLNKEVVDQESCLQTYVSEDLQYACRFWALHLTQTPPDQDLYNLVSSFCYKHLLHWLEVLSLLNSLEKAFWSLELARKWCQHFPDKDNQLVELILDGQRFIQEFYDPINLSALQVYVSALAFSPKDTTLYRHFTEEHKEVLTVPVGIESKWTSCLKTLEGHTDWVMSTIMSSDGKIIASGSYDHTLHLWDSTTGIPIGKPLLSHTAPVSSVAFSPDGKLLVSGSYDYTLRLWDVSKGTPIGEGFKQHSAQITSVVFSPKGEKIATSSIDNTVCLWNLGLDTPLVGIFEGHTDGVLSIAFSPDGKYLISGSLDQTLRLWHIESCLPVGEPFEGHTAAVTSVAFSPDGKTVVSSSYDKTICLWNIFIEPTAKRTQRLTDEITSLAFSPSGQMIVSGSHDNNICLWDSNLCNPIGAPFEGHSASVNSVSFSPDGQTIISGSSDKTLRLWNVSTGTEPGAPSKRHTKAITVMVFSPDGTKLVSGSYDSSLCLWDSDTGLLISSLEGHRHIITYVVFSPDGQMLLSRDNKLRYILWDINTLSQIDWTWLLQPDSGLASWPSTNDKQLYLAKDGWVFGPGERRVCWVPPTNRSHSGPKWMSTQASNGGRIALGSSLGRVTIIDARKLLGALSMVG